MGELITYFFGTEAQILALTSASPNWVEKAFYYPSDKGYFYQLVDGVMKRYGMGDGVLLGIGILLNDAVIGGVKTLIETNDVLTIPVNYEYNVYRLTIDGIINSDGVINLN